MVTWYTSLLLASLDRHDGHRHVRYCDLAGSIYGMPSWRSTPAYHDMLLALETDLATSLQLRALEHARHLRCSSNSHLALGGEACMQ